MIKRQRYYSGWEIAGLIGSTASLLYMLGLPLLFLLGYLIDGFYFDLIDAIFVFFVALIVALTLSLSFRQWFNPYPKMAIAVAVLSIASAIILPLIPIFDVMVLGGETPQYEFTEDIVYLVLWTIPFCILPIWMNRPRWRKVTPSPVEAFE